MLNGGISNVTMLLGTKILFLCLWPHHAAYEILVPQPGMEAVPPQQKWVALTKRPPGKLPIYRFFCLHNLCPKFPKLPGLPLCIAM